MPRNFTATPAVRRALPVSLGLFGETGTGKTFSALRVAQGMSRVSGKPTFLIDTENGRGLHYAPTKGRKADGVNTFDYGYIPFEPPYDADAYCDAIAHAISEGAGQIIVDSGSHEWEGEGGVLETQERLVAEKAGNDWKRREKLNMWGWIQAKKPHNRLRTLIGRAGAHQIWCFRGKNKLKIETGEEPKKLGIMPVAGTDLVFELMLIGVLKQGSRGVAEWHSRDIGEGLTVKVPRQFAQLTEQLRGPLSEDVGEALARWGAGDSAPAAQPAIRIHPSYAQQTGTPYVAGSVSEMSPAAMLEYIEWLRPKAADNAKAAEHLKAVESLYETIIEQEMSKS